jgi:hypothetical protein
LDIEALLKDEDEKHDNQRIYSGMIEARKCPVTVLNYETKEEIEMEVATIIDEYDDYKYISKSFLIELETTEI